MPPGPSRQDRLDEEEDVRHLQEMRDAGFLSDWQVRRMLSRFRTYRRRHRTLRLPKGLVAPGERIHVDLLWLIEQTVVPKDVAFLGYLYLHLGSWAKVAKHYRVQVNRVVRLLMKRREEMKTPP